MNLNEISNYGLDYVFNDVCNDSGYNQATKADYFLGKVSKVYEGNAVMQVENTSLLNLRNILDEGFIPNSINYYVAIESDNGIFLGRIFKAEISSQVNVNDSDNYNDSMHTIPEVSFDVVGYLSPQSKRFELPGLRTVGISNKVYLAPQVIVDEYVNSLDLRDSGREDVLESFADVKLSGVTSEFKINPNSLFDHHLMVVGATNSGKSTSSLAILDKLHGKGVKILMIDPTGEYRKTFGQDENFKKITLGEDVFIPTGEISLQQWCEIFGTNDNSQPAVLNDAIMSLKIVFNQSKLDISKYNSPEITEHVLVKNEKLVSDIDGYYYELSKHREKFDFDLNYLEKQLIEESVGIKKYSIPEEYEFQSFSRNNNNYLINKVRAVLGNTSLSKFVSNENGDNILQTLKNFVRNEFESLYIDLSGVGADDGLAATVVDIILNGLVNETDEYLETLKQENQENIEENIKGIVVFIDEVHRYTHRQKVDENDMLMDSGLTRIAREGRKKGLFLFLSTQSPNDVNKVIMSQMGSLLIHRLTSGYDLETIRPFLTNGDVSMIRKLNKGEAILTSINLLGDLHLQVEKSNRQHDNETVSLM